jgi:hypothetical protein
MANWEFNVLDKMTDPLKKMGSSLGDLESTISATSKELEKLERAAQLDSLKSASPIKQQIGYMKMYRDDLEKMRSHQESTAEKGGFFKRLFGEEGFFAAEQIERVYRYGEAIFELGKKFVEFGVEASDFKEDSIETLSVMLGTTEAAEKEFEMIGRMAKNSSMTKSEVMSQYTELFSFTQKFGSEATQNVVAAGADVGRLLNKGAQQAFLGVMKNIEAMGGLSERMVKQLKEVGVATPDKLYEALATRLHTTSKGAQALLKAGKISQEQSIDTLLDLVQKNVNKGEALGTYSVKMSAEDAGDAVKNLGDAWKDLFSDVDTAPIAAGINSLIAAMDPASESGKKMRDLLGHAFEDIGKMATYAADHMGEWVDKAQTVLGVIEKIGKFMDDHPTISKMLIGAAAGAAVGGGFGAVAGAAGGLGFAGGEALMSGSVDAAKQNLSDEKAKKLSAEQQLEALQAKLNAKLASNEQLEFNLSNAGIKSVSNPMADMAGKIEADVKVTAGQTADGFMIELSKKFQEGIPKIAKEQIVEGLKKGVDAHSPSREMMKIGRYSADGYVLGWNEGFNTFNMSAPSALIDDVREAIGREFTNQSPFQSPGVGGPVKTPFASSAPPITVTVSNSFAGGAPTDSASQSFLDESMSHAVETGILKAFESLNHQ